MDTHLSKAQESLFPLKVHLESMSDRTRALLEYYFENECRASFAHVAAVEQPDVVIVDYDHPGSRASVAAGKWRTGRPLLLLSFSESSVSGSVVLRKPFDKLQLQQAALRLVDETTPAGTESLEEEIDSSDGATASSSSEPVLANPHNGREADTENSPEAAVDITTTYGESTAGVAEPDTEARIRARQEMKVALLCGPRRSIADLEIADDTAHRYREANHLSGYLESALQQCGREGVIAVQLTLPEMEIFVLHWLQKILTTTSLKSARNVDRAFQSFDNNEITMTAYQSNTVNELVKRVNGTGRFSFSTEAFLWLSALFSARGRLPDDVQLDQMWRLTQWPNLTRLEPVPQGVETASAWSRKPASIRQIITRTGHQPRHVVSFFNGARALKLMEPVVQVLQSADPSSPYKAGTDKTRPDRTRPDRTRPDRDQSRQG